MTTFCQTTTLAIDLISKASVTPNDAECQALMISRLEACGFVVKQLKYGEVDNFWAIHGNKGPILCLAGHTDVVPPGPDSQWQSPPFEPTIRDGHLFGRGAADMKVSLAAMVVAAERFVIKNPNHSGRLAFLITSDEEGPAINGTVKVVEWLTKEGMTPTWCLVGEPSSDQKCGDTIKNGRRGSLSGELTVNGIQGHVAYPQLAANPIHLATPALNALINKVWDQGNTFFPPTSFQMSTISSGTGTTNVIPGSLKLLFNFRFSTEVTPEQLKNSVQEILNSHKLDYDINWHLSGMPFLTDAGALVDAACASIKTHTGIDTCLSTAGGTSDGRFIAPMGTQVVELGPINKTIHRVDENVSIDDLQGLTAIYHGIIERLLP